MQILYYNLQAFLVIKLPHYLHNDRKKYYNALLKTTAVKNKPLLKRKNLVVHSGNSNAATQRPAVFSFTHSCQSSTSIICNRRVLVRDEVKGL